MFETAQKGDISILNELIDGCGDSATVHNVNTATDVVRGSVLTLDNR